MSRATTTGAPVTPTPTANPTMARPMIPHDRIAKLAYEKWVKGGCQHGCDQQNWYEAEMELMKSSGMGTTTPMQRR